MNIFERVEKTPIKYQILIAVILVVCVFFTINKMTSKQDKNKKEFYLNGFCSKVIKSNTEFQRGEVFYLENKLEIYFLLPVGNKMLAGDSVCKVTNTYFYDVYRKDENGEYKFWSTYDFERVE
ncbi:MAG TPA: hypothetical protein VLZ83_11430 [Edaphocola sp.]|nr:hypothetical protein [Edaphocola sp.]